MRTIKEIIIHCSATLEGRNYTVSDIDHWHKARGFNMIGYHYVIYLDGTVHEGRPVSLPGAHCKGHNEHSIGICYIGGYDADTFEPKDTRTPQQRKAMLELIKKLKKRYPGVTIHGHNEYSDKACPCFNVSTQLCTGH